MDSKSILVMLEDARKYSPRSFRSLMRKSRSQTQAVPAAHDKVDYGTAGYSSLSSIKNKDLSRDELVSYTYDYLKSASLVPRSTEVRYFTEVKRAIRGRFRGMLNEKPVICPWIQSRYNRHKQHCLRKNVKTPSKLMGKNIKQQDKLKTAVPSTGANGVTTLRHTVSSNILSCQSRCEPCFCRVSPCEYSNTIKYTEPVQNSLNASLEMDIDELAHSPKMVKESQPQPDVSKIEDDCNKKFATVENVINEWLKTIPVYPNFSTNDKVKREKLIHKLAQTLKSLEKQINFPTLARKEVIRCLDVLPMWFPDDSDSKTILKDQFAFDLINRLAKLAERNFKIAISEGVKKLPIVESNANHDIIKETIDIFIDRLRPIALKRPSRDENYKDNLKVEVVKILRDIPLQEDKQNNDKILELADQLVEQLNTYNILNVPSEETKITFNNEIEKKIYSWCINILEFSKCKPKQLLDFVKSLAKKFTSKKLGDVKETNFRKALQVEIENWLERVSMIMKTNLSLERRHELSQQLIQIILGKKSKSIEQSNIKTDDEEDIKILDHIMKWFKHIQPELLGQYDEKMQESLKNLALKLKKIHIRDDDVEHILADMRRIISNWLNNCCKLTGIQLDSKAEDNLVNDLILKLNDTSKEQDINADLYKDVIAWLKELPDFKHSKNSEQNNPAREFIVKVTEIQRKSSEDTILPHIEKEIKDFVEKISYNSAKNVRPEDIVNLKSIVFKHLRKNDKLKLNDDSYKTESFSTGTHMNINKNLFESLQNLNPSPSINLNEVSNLKHETKNISKDYLIDNTPISAVYNNEYQSDIARNRNYSEDLADIKQNDIAQGNFTIDIGNNDTSSILLNIDKATKIIDKKIEERKSSNGYKNELTISKVDKSVQSEPTAEKDSKNSYVQKRFSTSTPLAITKYPSLSNDLLSSLNDSLITKMNPDKEATSELSQYLNKVKNIVKKWLQHFNLDVNDQEKYDLINNITNDILDRRKYIQVSGVNTTEREELEHLKYQIYQRLHNLDNSKVLRDIVDNVDCLNHRILSLESPKVIKIRKYETEQKNNKDITTADSNVQASVDDLVNKITNWFQKNYSMFIDTLEDRRYDEIIRDLAHKLDTLKLNNLSDSALIKEVISQWLSNFFDVDIKKPNDLAESLKIYLFKTCSRETLIPKQDTSEFVLENLTGAIVEWFQTTQFKYQLQNQIQDYFALLLAKDIKKVFAQTLANEEINRLIINEIITGLGKVTGDSSHSLLHYAIASDLIKYLKELKLFHDISDKDIINGLKTRDEAKDNNCKVKIREAIINWLNGSSLQENIMMRDTKEVINNFVESIIKYNELNDLSNIEKVLKDYILRLINEMSLKFDRQGYSDIEVDALVATIKDIIFICNQQMVTKLTKDTSIQVNIDRDDSPSEVYKQLLHDTVSKTFFEKLTLEEQVSFNLLKEKLAEAFIDLYHGTNDKEFKIKLKNKLYKEISKFCDEYLRHRPVSPIYSNKLQEDLHKVLKNVTSPTIGTKIEINESKLRNVINKWFKSIPIKRSEVEYLNIPLMVTELAKRTYSLIKKTDLELNSDKLKLEIIDWLKNIPIEIYEVGNIDDFADKLAKKLKSLATNMEINDSETYSEDYINESDIEIRQTNDTQFTPQIPPTSLSKEDSDHLKRIRARSDSQAKDESPKHIISQNSSVNSYVHTGIQTNTDDKVTKCVQTSNTSLADVRREISPQVIIREFYWDSRDSKHSLQIDSTAMSPEKRVSQNTKVTSASQTEPKIYYKVSKAQTLSEPVNKSPITKDGESQTIDDAQHDVSNKIDSILPSSHPEDISDPQHCASQDFMGQQNKISKPIYRRKQKQKEYSDKILERETMYDLKTLEDHRKVTPGTKLVSGQLSPVLITEQRSERRFYASPQYVNARDIREDKICCSCKNHLLTQCRNKPTSGCRNSTRNTLKHCSKCFGGYCPHPSYFFFRKDF